MNHKQVAQWETLCTDAAELLRRGEFQSATLVANEALEMAEASSGPGDPDVATSLNILAAIHYEQRQYEKTEPLIRRALSIYRMALGPDHPEVGMCLENIAALYRATGREGEAKILAGQAERIYAINTRSDGDQSGIPADQGFTGRMRKESPVARGVVHAASTGTVVFEIMRLFVNCIYSAGVQALMASTIGVVILMFRGDIPADFLWGPIVNSLIISTFVAFLFGVVGTHYLLQSIDGDDAAKVRTKQAFLVIQGCLMFVGMLTGSIVTVFVPDAVIGSESYEQFMDVSQE